MSDNTHEQAKRIEITEEQYNEALNQDQGICIECKDFTKDGVEPDAENYECPVCEQDSVFGVPQALIMNLIFIKE